MDTYKLTYFGIHGIAHHIRLLFAVGKVPFQDDIVKMKDWPEKKPTTEMGFLPVLTINDSQTISQSLAVGRYVAKVTEFYGSNIYEEGRIDMIVDTCKETIACWEETFFMQAEGKVKEDGIQKIKTSCTHLSKILGDEDYFVGNKISWADISFYTHFILISDVAKEVIPELGGILKDTPNLELLFDRVDQHLEIVDFNEKNQMHVLPPAPKTWINTEKYIADLARNITDY